MTSISIRKANFYLQPVAQDPANSTSTKKLMRTTTSPPGKYLHHPALETGGLSLNCTSIFWLYLSMRAQTPRFGFTKCSSTSFDVAASAKEVGSREQPLPLVCGITGR